MAEQAQEAPQEAQEAAVDPVEAEAQASPPEAQEPPQAQPCAPVKVGRTHMEFDILLSPYELRGKGASLSNIVLEIQQVEAEKAEVVADFGAKIKGLKKRLNETAETLRSGKVREYRTADIYFDKERGKVVYKDCTSGIVYQERDVEPGEQFALPIEEQPDKVETATAEVERVNDGDTEVVPAFPCHGHYGQREFVQGDCDTCPNGEACNSLTEEIKDCFGKNPCDNADCEVHTSCQHVAVDVDSSMGGEEG